MKLPKPAQVISSPDFKYPKVRFKGKYFNRQMRRIRKGL